MFKEESIELGCKLFCLLVFMAVIAFLGNIYSLLVLFLYFFLANRKRDDSIGVTILCLLTLLGVAFGFINNSLVLFKLLLIIDFIYYFARFFKENKKSFWGKGVNVEECDEVTDDTLVGLENSDINSNYYDSDEVVVSDYKINEISNELKKGNLLKEDDINLIKSHLVDKEKDELEEKTDLKYLRFSGFKSNLKNVSDFCINKVSKFSFKNSSKSYKWQFNLDDINGLYVMCHLLVLLLAIVVE